MRDDTARARMCEVTLATVLILRRQVVTLYTIKYNAKIFTFCPHSESMYLVCV
jgi:hypothetical protein